MEEVSILFSLRGFISVASVSFGIELDPVYKAELVIEDKVLLELKSVDSIHPAHEAQLLTYLRTSGYPVRLLINFNTAALADGIRRRVA